MRTKHNCQRIPPLLHTQLFLDYTKLYIARFIKQQGFGRWIKEYQAMQDNGQLTPHYIQQEYEKLLKHESQLPYLPSDVVRYIGYNALASASVKAALPVFNIVLITGEIAEDDNGKELKGLYYDHAAAICKHMNDEAEEYLFFVKANKLC